MLRCVRKPVYRGCLTLMYACGVRIGEAASLEVSAVDGVQRLVRVIGKGNRERHVPLPVPTLAMLRTLWKTHRHVRWLFPNVKGTQPVPRCTLYRAFRAARDAAGLPNEVTPHSLRHGYATRLLERGIDLRVIQVLLGHGCIQSTTIYTHLTEPMRASLHALLDDIMAGL